MAKKKQEIEEAVVVEESTYILLADFQTPVLPKLIDRATSIVTIKESLKEYSKIEINGTKDKVNYDKVSKGMAKFKTDRIAWKRAVVENVQDPVKAWLDETKLDIYAIEEEFKTAESELRTKKEAIDTLKAEEKQAAETAKLKVMAERIEAIVNLGGKSDGTRYLFDYDITLFVSIAQLKDMEEVKWQNELADIQKAYDFEQTRLADQKKVEEELAEANNTKEKELKDKQRALRIKELKMEGFVVADELSFSHPIAFEGSLVTVEMIDEYTDEQWDSMILDYQNDTVFQTTPREVNSFDITNVDDVEKAPLVFEPVTKAAIPAIDYEPKEELSFETTQAEEEISEMPFDNGFKIVTLQFDALDPYIEFPMGEGFIQRLFIEEFQDYALEVTETQKIVLQGDTEYDLKFVLIKVN